MLMTKPRSNPSTPVRERSPHSMTMTASPGSSMRSATSIFDTPGNTRRGPGGASRFTRRTSLPSCHRANAIASCDPMASPSGRTCEDSTKRWRPRISSAIRARAVTSLAVVLIVPAANREISALGCALRVLLMNVSKDLLDAVLVLDRFVEAELNFWDVSQMMQPAADLAAEKSGGALERPRRVLARFLIAEARVEHARQLQVRRHLYARQRDEADAGVVDLAAGEDVAQFLANLVADSVGPVALCHRSYAVATFTLSIVNTSMRSPFLMSLKRSKP